VLGAHEGGGGGPGGGGAAPPRVPAHAGGDGGVRLDESSIRRRNCRFEACREGGTIVGAPSSAQPRCSPRRAWRGWGRHTCGWSRRGEAPPPTAPPTASLSPPRTNPPESSGPASPPTGTPSPVPVPSAPTTHKPLPTPATAVNPAHPSTRTQRGAARWDQREGGRRIRG
jgi:hypothetical protein